MDGARRRRSLREAIAEIGERRAAEPKTLIFARRLFARTVETPGGLKIHTIHGFCERLLHLFPFEANVPARFEVMDDIGEAELLARRAGRTLSAGRSEPGELGTRFERISAETSQDRIRSI